MITVMVLIRKRPDLTPAQFRDHYENRHAPLIDRLLPYYQAYRRNYLETPVRPGQADVGYDVVTELEFADEETYDAWQDALRRPEVIAEIRADEAHFLAAGETRMWRVDRRESVYGTGPA